MAGRLVRVWSSAANLEEHDDEAVFVIERDLVPAPHVLDEGADYFDAHGKPVRPEPQSIKKAFSGSALDLNAMCGSAQSTPQMGPAPAPGGAAAGAAMPPPLPTLGAAAAVGGGVLSPGSPASSPQSRGVVAVIGGTHYLNGHLVTSLLERGYLVHVIMQDAPPAGSIAPKISAAAAAAASGGNPSSEPTSPTSPNSGSAEGGSKKGASAFPSTPSSAPTAAESTNNNTNTATTATSSSTASPAALATPTPTPSAQFGSSDRKTSSRSNVAVKHALELLTLAGAHQTTKNRLFVSEGTDMFSGSSLRDALRKSGCRYIIHGGVHIGSQQQQHSAQKIYDLHRSAVVALFEALRGLRSGSVERVVVTCAPITVAHPDTPVPARGFFDESDKNVVSTAATEPLAYAQCYFESEVWRMRTTLPSTDFTVIIPSVMLGPSRTSESSDAMRLVLDFARNSSYFPFAPNIFWNFVDVRDVAAAHVLSLENNSARNRRYIVSNCLLSLPELGGFIRGANSRLKAPVYTMPTLLALLGPMMPGSRVKYDFVRRNLGLKRRLGNKRVTEELQLPLRRFDETIKDCIQELAAQNLLPEARGEVSADWAVTKVMLASTAVSTLVAAGALWFIKQRNNGVIPWPAWLRKFTGGKSD